MTSSWRSTWLIDGRRYSQPPSNTGRHGPPTDTETRQSRTADFDPPPMASPEARWTGCTPPPAHGNYSAHENAASKLTTRSDFQLKMHKKRLVTRELTMLPQTLAGFKGVVCEPTDIIHTTDAPIAILHIRPGSCWNSNTVTPNGGIKKRRGWKT